MVEHKWQDIKIEISKEVYKIKFIKIKIHFDKYFYKLKVIKY